MKVSNDLSRFNSGVVVSIQEGVVNIIVKNVEMSTDMKNNLQRRASAKKKWGSSQNFKNYWILLTQKLITKKLFSKQKEKNLTF